MNPYLTPHKIELYAEEFCSYCDLVKLSYIRHVGGKWKIYSEKGKVLGTYDTKAEAAKRLGQIEWFKKHKNSKKKKASKNEEQSYSSTMRKLRKSHDEKDVKKFQEEYKKLFDAAMIAGMEDDDAILDEALKCISYSNNNTFEARASTVYRKCPCGETAFDYVGGTTTGEPWTKEKNGGTKCYACRNCRRRIMVRKRDLNTHKLGISNQEDQFIKRIASAIDLGDPAFSGKYLADLIRFLLRRISAPNRQKAIESLKKKIYYINEFDIAAKKTPPSSSMGQSITLIKTILLEHPPQYIRNVLNSIVRNL